MGSIRLAAASSLFSFLFFALLAMQPAPTAAEDNRALARVRPEAASGNTQERRLALVIGNSAYQSSPLRNPANDAAAMSRALRELGFEVSEGLDLNYWKMMEIIDEFGEQIKDGGIALFYYAGHAMQVQGNNYLIPVDADLRSEKEARYKTVNAGLVLAKMDAAQTKTNLVILDACRNNPFARSFRSNQQGLAQMDAPGGTLIAYATAPGKVASDGSGNNGLYTEALLKYLGQPGFKIEDIFKRVRADVRDATSGEQTPWESSSLVGDFYFKPQPAAAPVATLEPQPPRPQQPAPVQTAKIDPLAVELSFWDSVKDSKNPAIFRTYLTRYPQGTFAELAKLKIQALEKPQPSYTPPSPSPPAALESDNDRQLTRNLLGTWESSQYTDEGVMLYGRTNYLPGGKFNLTGTAVFQGQQIPIVLSGTWEIKNNYRHYKIDSSNMEELIPRGYSSAEEIIEITEDEFVYISEGEEMVEYRIDPTEPYPDFNDMVQDSAAVQQGSFCCDTYGYRRCVIEQAATVGEQCFCPEQGYGFACQ